jgi:hypothetical protein
MKLLLIISLLISLGFLGLLPQKTFAATGDELLDRLLNKLIDISLGVWSLIKQVNELINSTSSLYPLTLGDYLKQLFESHNIILDKDDFLEEIKYPYVEGAKILNLIPSSWQNNQKITQFQAKQISEKLLSIKDKILLDGLYGKIDMHEHYRAGGNIEEFLKAAGALGISKIVFVPTGLNPDNRGYKTYSC